MYSVRVKSPQRLEDLAALVSHDSKSVPGDKELRVGSEGWKVKETPGTGKSFGRAPHRKAALSGVEALWSKALRDRNCSQIEAPIWAAADLKGAAHVTVKKLAHLLAVTSTIDDIHKQTELSVYLASELVLHAVKEVGIENLQTQSARLTLAAEELVNQGESFGVAAAYKQAGEARPKAVVTLHQTPSRSLSSSAQTPSPAATLTISRLPPKPQPSRATTLDAPAATQKPPQPVANHRHITDTYRARSHTSIILRLGGAPGEIARHVSATEKPLLIESLVDTLLASLAAPDQADQRDTWLVRASTFFDTWQDQAQTTLCCPFTREDRAALPPGLVAAMQAAVERRAAQLPATH